MTEKMGRGLFAKQNIDKGEIVIIEKSIIGFSASEDDKIDLSQKQDKTQSMECLISDQLSLKG